MKLHSKKARVPIAALGVTALICGAGALASPAFAAGPALTITPTTTSVNMVNIGAAASAEHTGGGVGTFDILQPLADATYGFRVTSTAASLKLSVDSFTPSGTTAPAKTGVYFGELPTAAAGAGGPVSVPLGTGLAAWKMIDTTTLPATATVTGGGATPNSNVFLAPAAPGTYVVHFVDAGATGGTDDDSVSPSVTLNVKDAFVTTTGVAGDLVDDWAPTVSNSASSAGIGAPITTTVGLSSLTLADARGTSSGVGVLAAKVAALVGVRFNHSVADTATQWTSAPNATTYTGRVAVSSAGTRTIPVGVTSAAGTVTGTASFDRAGDGIGVGDIDLGTPAGTVVASNSVTTVPTLAAKDVTGSVKQAAAAVAVKTGTAAVTYNATVDPAAASKVVYFTVYADSGTAVANAANIAKLTTSGTAVDVSGTTSKIYSAVTDSLGVASLTVTSSDPKAADSYKVTASSNGHVAIADPILTTTYSNPVGASAMITNSVAELTPDVTTTSITIKGKVTDQFGSSYQPASSASQQAQLFVGTTAVSCSAVTLPKATAPSDGNATIVAGAFTFTYTPATTPVSGTCTPFTIGYDGNGDASIVTLESDSDSINWASTTAAGTVTLTSPVDAATNVNLSASTVIAPGQSTADTGTGIGADVNDFGAVNGEVTGTVVDAANAALPYKTVVLTGTEGVYFSSSPTGSDLVATLTVVSNNVGVFGGGYAFFTKPGAAKITAKVGTVSDEASLTTDASDDPFKVTANDAAGTPGSTLIVTGKLTDFFGNPVPNSTVSLSIGTSTVGGLTDSTPETNSDGIYSTSFITGANQSGEVELTATIPTQTANAVPVTGWTTVAKLSGLPTAGEYTDKATITVTAQKLTLTATAKLIGGGKAKVGGSFLPNTGVDIYSKASGAASYTLLDSLQADDEGDFGASYSIKKTTSFLAKSAGMSSKTVTTKVYSKVTITAKSLSRGHATIYANGSPSAKGSLKFYRSVAGKDPLLKSMTSNSSGNGTATVKLPKGTRYVYAVFHAPGTYTGASGTVKVKVK